MTVIGLELSEARGERAREHWKPEHAVSSTERTS